MSDFPETLYASDRETAKAHAEHPLTAEYIARLERTASVAFAYWKKSPSLSEFQNELFEALDAVNFLNERP